jgi:hypothetical protein
VDRLHTVTGDWRDFRPAIWLALLGVAAILLFSPWYLGAVFLGGAIGIAGKTVQRRRRRPPAAAPPQRRPRR